MSGILLVVGNNKSDIVETIKTKIWLQGHGKFVCGLVKDIDINENVPTVFLEDMIGLRVITSLD